MICIPSSNQLPISRYRVKCPWKAKTNMYSGVNWVDWCLRETPRSWATAHFIQLKGEAYDILRFSNVVALQFFYKDFINWHEKSKGFIGSHLSTLCRNVRTFAYRAPGMKRCTCDSWNFHIWLTPVFDSADLDKCRCWQRSALCFALKHSCFRGFVCWNKPERSNRRNKAFLNYKFLPSRLG